MIILAVKGIEYQRMNFLSHRYFMMCRIIEDVVNTLAVTDEVQRLMNMRWAGK